MKHVMITGCNRGIGLSLVKQFLRTNQPPTNIIATCRSCENAKELVELAQNHSQLKIIEIDLKEFNKYNSVSEQVDQITQEDGLNLLINNAGISTKFTRLGQLKLEQLMNNFVINTCAPIMLVKALHQHLKKASEKNKELPLSVQRAAVINISSILGSISQNADGGFYPYRCSKSALNAATKSLSLDLKNDGILVTAIHPGWCKTDMGGKNAPLETDVATAKMIETLEKLGSEQNGQFLQYDGKVLPY